MTDKPNVIPFTGITKLDTDPDQVLQHAIGKLDDCVIVGYGKDGSFYFASTKSDAAEAVWRLERGKHELMKMVDDLEGQNP